jgi:hypothetical protein
MNRYLLIFVSLLWPRITSFSQHQSPVVQDPVSSYFRLFAEDSAEIDPEQTVLETEFDFNCDGILDIALSNPNLCGNAGCLWDLYLAQDSGGYMLIGDIFFNDGGIYIERLEPDSSKAIVFIHDNAVSGSLMEYRISQDGIKETGSTPSDTANWSKFLSAAHGRPSPIKVRMCNILNYLRTGKAK